MHADVIHVAPNTTPPCIRPVGCDRGCEGRLLLRPTHVFEDVVEREKVFNDCLCRRGSGKERREISDGERVKERERKRERERRERERNREREREREEREEKERREREREREREVEKEREGSRPGFARGT